MSIQMLSGDGDEVSKKVETALTSGIFSESLQSRWYNAEHYDPDDKWAGFDPQRTAVVLVDLINWQAHPDGASIRAIREGDIGDEGARYILNRFETLLMPGILAVLDAARAAGAHVVHARLASQSEDYSDVVQSLQPYVRAAQALDGSWGSKVIDGLEDPRDISVVKSASGAYTSSSLDLVLRRMGIHTVLYAGVVTNGCVLLTAAAGYDLGYRQYLLTDCTAAWSEEDQHHAERLMDSFIAQAVTAADAVKAFERSPSRRA